MTHSVTLHRDDLQTLIQFIDAMSPTHQSVMLEVDSSSGIGSTITAHIHGVEVNGQRVTVSKEIVNEEDW